MVNATRLSDIKSSLYIITPYPISDQAAIAERTKNPSSQSLNHLLCCCSHHSSNPIFCKQAVALCLHNANHFDQWSATTSWSACLNRLPMHQGQGSAEQVVTYLQMLNGLLLLMTAALGSVQAAMQVCIVLRKTCALCSSLPPLLAQHLEGGMA